MAVSDTQARPEAEACQKSLYSHNALTTQVGPASKLTSRSNPHAVPADFVCISMLPRLTGSHDALVWPVSEASTEEEADGRRTRCLGCTWPCSAGAIPNTRLLGNVVHCLLIQRTNHLTCAALQTPHLVRHS